MIYELEHGLGVGGGRGRPKGSRNGFISPGAAYMKNYKIRGTQAALLRELPPSLQNKTNFPTTTSSPAPRQPRTTRSRNITEGAGTVGRVGRAVSTTPINKPETIKFTPDTQQNGGFNIGDIALDILSAVPGPVGKLVRSGQNVCDRITKSNDVAVSELDQSNNPDSNWSIEGMADRLFHPEEPTFDVNAFVKGTAKDLAQLGVDRVQSIGDFDMNEFANDTAKDLAQLGVDRTVEGVEKLVNRLTREKKSPGANRERHITGVAESMPKKGQPVYGRSVNPYDDDSVASSKKYGVEDFLMDVLDSGTHGLIRKVGKVVDRTTNYREQNRLDNINSNRQSEPIIVIRPLEIAMNAAKRQAEKKRRAENNTRKSESLVKNQNNRKTRSAAQHTHYVD